MGEAGKEISNFAPLKPLSVAYSFTYLPYTETGYFSHLVTDYVGDDKGLQPFYLHAPTAEGITNAISARSQIKTDRKTLVDALHRQYELLPKYARTAENIRLLGEETTYTVCTAHQPNLLTGYLYFIYKIIHAIKLAEQLSAQHPGLSFVPVYYMGSEDNDIEELGAFRFRGQKYVWDGSGQQGAVGRMDTASLKDMLHRLLAVFGPPGSNCDELTAMLTAAYMQHKTIAQATHYLVNELFGRFGLVVLNPDDDALKKTFIPVMKDELLHQRAYPVITEQVEQLAKCYKTQANPRMINLFYLAEQVRERIEKKGDKWVVVNTDIQWNQDELLAELEEHPERFSPNVMLRGLYQETILPDVAFIGGGAEVAYWLQLKALFALYDLPYPVLLLRQSVLWIGPVESRLLSRASLPLRSVFKKENDLVRDHVAQHTHNEWQTAEEAKQLTAIFHSLRQKATALDPTLKSAAEAALTKMKQQLAVLEIKMLRAEKKKMQTELARITKIKNILFPNNSLQERVENFTEYYLQYGSSFLDILKEVMDPLKNQFLVIEAVPVVKQEKE